MKIIIIASPVSGMEVCLLDAQNNTRYQQNVFCCDVISCTQDLLKKHSVQEIIVTGPRNYITNIVEELREKVNVPVTVS